MKYDSFFDEPKTIFGLKFVENNINSIRLIINGRKSILIEKYYLKEGENYIQLIKLTKLTNLEHIFSGSCTLKNMEELKFLNVSNANNFSGIFYGSTPLSEIKYLRNWNVKYKYFFQLCSFNNKKCYHIIHYILGIIINRINYLLNTFL